MRRLLFSPQLNPGWEGYAFLRSVLVTLALTIIGLVAAHLIDIAPSPTVAAASAIIMVAFLQFWILRKYSFVTALNIGMGGSLVCSSVLNWQTHGWSAIPLGLVGLIVTVRYYSEGPVQK